MNKKRLLELNRIFDEQVERLIANENLYKNSSRYQVIYTGMILRML